MQAVQAAWQRIEKWLEAEVPELADRLPGPASKKAIAAAEAAVGLKFPEALKASYQIQDGVEYGEDELTLFPPDLDGIMDTAFCLLPVEAVEQEWLVWKDLIDCGEFDGYKGEPQPGITDDWWSASWIPVAGNGGGDFICVDVAPTDQGTVGQVILAWHDSSERLLLASSWDAYLEKLAAAMESGRLKNDEDYGLIVSNS